MEESPKLIELHKSRMNAANDLIILLAGMVRRHQKQG